MRDQELMQIAGQSIAFSLSLEPASAVVRLCAVDENIQGVIGLCHLCNQLVKFLAQNRKIYLYQAVYGYDGIAGDGG